ncbi:MAG: electron transfer flavoprotein subunit beta/FixA family protein [Planctomycetota bacterium]|nr:electron transfer flavoprotein subunit beta/FixA family protein [Planctomycetota bacterium]
MKIIVCVKRVVDTETRVKIGPDGTSIDLGGVQFITAPYDEMAVEKAIQLRDAAGEGSVTVVTVGPAAATKELRTALAMGADAAVHAVVEDRLGPNATAAALAEVITGREYDLILCGKQATDEDDAAVGPLLAAALDLPCVAFVHGLDVEGRTALAEREIDGQAERLDVDLPAVFTAQKGLAEPRYPGLKGIMAAKKKPLETVEVDTSGGLTTIESLELPAARAAMVTIDPTPEGMQSLLTALRNDKKVL